MHRAQTKTTTRTRQKKKTPSYEAKRTHVKKLTHPRCSEGRFHRTGSRARRPCTRAPQSCNKLLLASASSDTADRELQTGTNRARGRFRGLSKQSARGAGRVSKWIKNKKTRTNEKYKQNKEIQKTYKEIQRNTKKYKEMQRKMQTNTVQTNTNKCAKMQASVNKQKHAKSKNHKKHLTRTRKATAQQKHRKRSKCWSFFNKKKTDKFVIVLKRSNPPLNAELMHHDPTYCFKTLFRVWSRRRSRNRKTKNPLCNSLRSDWLFYGLFERF